MDEETRMAALKKLRDMKRVIGYPDEFMNDSLIEKRYNSLEISSDQYLLNRLNVSRANKNLKISQLRETIISRNDWTENVAAVVNAFYSWPFNQIGN